MTMKMLDVKGNGSRCPVLTAGLFAVCLYLIFTWWSISSQASELVKQLDNLTEELKTYGDELGKCTQEKTVLDEKLKETQNKYVQQEIKIEQVKESEDEAKESYQKVETELEESKKKSESVEKSLGMCQAELDSLKKLSESKDKATETLRTQIESLKSEINQKKKQIFELKTQMKSFNKTGVPGNNKLIKSLTQNFNPAAKANRQQEVKTTNEFKMNEKGDQQNEEKLDDRKIFADPELLSLDRDPREEEMKGS